MGIGGLLKGILGGGQSASMEAEGSLIAKPEVVEREGSPRIMVFRLDTMPDLEFHQEISPLAAEHHKGDQVKVHYQLVGGIGQVEWVERIEAKV